MLEKAVAVKPHSRQLEWQRLEFNIFIHFGPNSISGREWGTGQEDPKLFNPAGLDCRQWARLSREAGAKAILLVAKHHDGFCLWPSQYTEFSVKNSPWRQGRGDLVKEMADACREYQLKFGVYLSPADMHEPTYGANSDAYNEFFKNQLRELLTQYGEINEVFFDGAQPTRKNQVYDYPAYYRLIRELQPNAVIASRGPDVRWVGNERGFARESEWSVVPLSASPETFHWPDRTEPDLGSRKRIEHARFLHWYPAEADVCLGGSWFYHQGQDAKVLSLSRLLDIYYHTVGRNAVLLLNLSPNEQGLITETSAKRLLEFGAVLRRTFATNFVAGARATASNTRTPEAGFSAQHMVDGKPATFWMAKDWCGPVELEIDLPGPVRFDRLMLQEHIESGQRIEAFGCDAWWDGNWQEIGRGTTVGYKRLLRFKAVTSDRLRIRIAESRVCPTLAEVGLYLEEPSH